MSKTRLLCGSVALLTVLGCRGDTPRPLTSNQRDSAGVTIVESSGPRWSGGKGWTVGAEPILDLAAAGAGPSHEFFRVRGAIRFANGDVAVANSGSNEVRFFNASGEFLRQIGGKGEGPGEFTWLWSIDRYRGDSLVAFDYRLKRVTVLGREGATPRLIPLRDVPVRDLVATNEGGFVVRLFWASAELYEGKSGTLVRTPDPLVRLSDSGDVTDTVTMTAGYEEFMSERGPAMPLFGKDSHFAVYGGRVYVGDATQMEFRVLSTAGRLERIIRVPGVDLSITAGDLQDERAGRLGPNPSPNDLKAFSTLPIPVTKPAYTRLLVDSEGCIWAEEYRHPWLSLSSGRTRSWRVFGVEGEWLGSVGMPAPFSVFEIGADYVLGVSRDDMEVEHVQILRLNRTY